MGAFFWLVEVVECTIDPRGSAKFAGKVARLSEVTTTGWWCGKIGLTFERVLARGVEFADAEDGAGDACGLTDRWATLLATDANGAFIVA